MESSDCVSVIIYTVPFAILLSITEYANASYENDQIQKLKVVTVYCCFVLYLDSNDLVHINRSSPGFGRKVDQRQRIPTHPWRVWKYTTRGGWHIHWL